MLHFVGMKPRPFGDLAIRVGHDKVLKDPEHGGDESYRVGVLLSSQ